MVTVMITLFAIVVVGYAAGKLGYMGGTFDKRLSKVVIDITCPALILSSSMTGELPDRQYILPLLLISVITYIVLTGMAYLLPRFLTRNQEDEGIIGFALIFGNVGFMGYPVVASIFGHEAIFYAAVLNVVNTFAVFTIGTMLVTGKSEVEGRKFQKKVLYSTPMLAAYVTMAIVALRIDSIPVYISQPLTMIGNITVPAALLIVGSSMSPSMSHHSSVWPSSPSVSISCAVPSVFLSLWSTSTPSSSPCPSPPTAPSSVCATAKTPPSSPR